VTSKTTTLLILALFLLTSCSIQVQTETATTPTLFIITATLPPFPTSHPSETPLQPPPRPTTVPVQGTTSTQLNVRSEPSTASEVLGIITANSIVQIVGKDPGENWWQILYEAGPDGKGWVTAQYVQTEGNPDIPVIGGGTEQGTENSAIVIQQINIRSGPGTSFDSLGILNANDVTNLTGRNRDGTWLQIEFSSGPDGKGWVSSGFVKADNVDNLPIVADSGEVVGTGTPVDTPLPPTPTVIPAAMDFDTADAPLQTVIFERAGTNSLIYSGDVSSPNGDMEDWIAFTPYEGFVFVSIQCVGNGSVQVEFTGIDSILGCGQNASIAVVKDKKVLVHISAIPSLSQLQYTQYTLTIKSAP